MQVNAPDSLPALVEQRAESLEARGRRDPATESLTGELRERLAAGSTVRRLDPLERRDRSLAEDLAHRESVNPLTSGDDLRRRLAPDRAVYVLEHPELPGRPVNVLWVALCRGLPDRLDEVLSPGAPVLDPASATAAVFYSVWVTEPTFAGVGRASQLVAAASEELAGLHAELSVHSTMSPVPGLRAWMEQQGVTDEARAERMCARYLTSLSEDRGLPEDRGLSEDHGRPLDPVARFHLGNGARLYRVLGAADGSELGRQRSFGVMANYRYRPEDAEANKASLRAGRVVVGDQVDRLLSEAPDRR